MPKIILDPDGDVCLQLQGYKPHEPVVTVMGSSSQPNTDEGQVDSTLDLIVSSKVLSVASPIFKTMFFGRFKEGVELARSKAFSQVYTVELPEDHAQAMLILCSVIHSKDEHIPVRPDTSLLQELALLADKYQCVQALKFPAESWLTGGSNERGWLNEFRWIKPRTLDATKKTQLVQCLFFAYTLNLTSEYASIAAILVQLDDGRMLEEMFSATHFRHDVLDALRKERRRWTGRVYKSLMQPISLSRKWAPADMCYAKAIGVYVNTLKAASVWPSSIDFVDQSLMTICNKVVRLPKIKDVCHKEDCICCLESKPTWMVDLKYACRRLTNELSLFNNASSVYLCVQCLKTGHLPEAQKTCKIQHVVDSA